MREKTATSRRVVCQLVCAGASLLLGLPGCRRAAPPAPAAPAAPYGPIRTIRDIQQERPALAGQVVRLRGRMTGIRDLNPGLSFPWDVVYIVEDGTGTAPVHWFTQEQSPKGRKPPVLAGDIVVVTGKLRHDVELEGKRYPLLIHEMAELHNQERPILPTSPTVH